MASSLKDSEEEHSRIEGLKDEALLFVDQALLLEETHHIREVINMILSKLQFIIWLKI